MNIRRIIYGLQSKEAAQSMNMMDFVQAKRGKLDEAIKLLMEAYEVRKSLGDLVKAAESLLNLGHAHRDKKSMKLRWSATANP